MKALRRGSAVLLASTSVALAGNDWKNSPLHHWFDGLASKRGVCCSYANGVTLTDVEWDMKDGHYRAFLEGRWIEVPGDAIVVAPNTYGRAIVWPHSVYVGNENGWGAGKYKDYQDSLLHARSASVSM
jgi:hypothetical protein